MELGSVVRFASHPRPFLVKDTYCTHPDCSCNAVILKFTEVSDTGQSLETLLSYANVLTDENALSTGGNAYTYKLCHRGRAYLVEDLPIADTGSVAGLEKHPVSAH